jgi:hypothetical protein
MFVSHFGKGLTSNRVPGLIWIGVKEYDTKRCVPFSTKWRGLATDLLQRGLVETTHLGGENNESDVPRRSPGRLGICICLCPSLSNGTP